jgi:ArsR family transcriptional regulator
LLTALGHPVRLRIVEGLLTGECCVGNMVECLQLPQPLVSRHLAILREAGVVSVERMGRKRSYRVIHPGAARLLQCLGGSGASTTASKPNNDEE